MVMRLEKSRNPLPKSRPISVRSLSQKKLRRKARKPQLKKQINRKAPLCFHLRNLQRAAVEAVAVVAKVNP